MIRVHLVVSTADTATSGALARIGVRRGLGVLGTAGVGRVGGAVVAISLRLLLRASTVLAKTAQTREAALLPGLVEGTLIAPTSGRRAWLRGRVLMCTAPATVRVRCRRGREGRARSQARDAAAADAGGVAAAAASTPQARGSATAVPLRLWLGSVGGIGCSAGTSSATSVP